MAVLFLPVSARADAKKGRVIYDRLCWWCHGSEGEGDGPAAGYLNPPPRDFTMGLYKWKSTPQDEIMPSDDDWRAMIAGAKGHKEAGGWDGLAGTSMPGWAGVLGDGEMQDVIEYIKSLGGMEEPVSPPVAFEAGPGPTDDLLAKGKELFESRCSECHGKKGRGNGEKGLKDDWGARTWPRDLTKGWTFRAGSGAEAIYRRITVGVPSTQMPSFADPASRKALTGEERRAVAYYVASLDAPYKRPTSDTVIKAKRIRDALPSPSSSVWDGTPFTSLYLFPQILAGDRLFTPSVDSISIKALYNDSAIAFYVEWDDPTMSVPGDRKAGEIAGGEVYPDMAAVQFPSVLEADSRAPYFGMGDASGQVDIWSWNAADGAGLMNARGTDRIVKKDAAASGLAAEGYYDNGTWKVVFTRPLKAPSNDGTSFKEGVFTPVAFATWDGSNGEKGSRHSMTGWASIRLESAQAGGLYAWPVVIAVIFLAAEMLWARSVRKG